MYTVLVGYPRIYPHHFSVRHNSRIDMKNAAFWSIINPAHPALIPPWQSVASRCLLRHLKRHAKSYRHLRPPTEATATEAERYRAPGAGDRAETAFKGPVRPFDA